MSAKAATTCLRTFMSQSPDIELNPDMEINPGMKQDFEPEVGIL